MRTDSIRPDRLTKAAQPPPMSCASLDQVIVPGLEKRWARQGRLQPKKPGAIVHSQRTTSSADVGVQSGWANLGVPIVAVRKPGFPEHGIHFTLVNGLLTSSPHGFNHELDKFWNYWKLLILQRQRSRQKLQEQDPCTKLGQSFFAAARNYSRRERFRQRHRDAR